MIYDTLLYLQGMINPFQFPFFFLTHWFKFNKKEMRHHLNFCYQCNNKHVCGKHVRLLYQLRLSNNSNISIHETVCNLEGM